MADIIQIRRDTAANWTSANPILAQGEMGFELDTQKSKVGDGATALTSLTDSSSGGATGGGVDEAFLENDQTVTTDYTIPAGKNAMSTGPITINTGVTVTVSTGSTWVVL